MLLKKENSKFWELKKACSRKLSCKKWKKSCFCWVRKYFKNCNNWNKNLWIFWKFIQKTCLDILILESFWKWLILWWTEKSWLKMWYYLSLISMQIISLLESLLKLLNIFIILDKTSIQCTLNSNSDLAQVLL